MSNVSAIVIQLEILFFNGLFLLVNLPLNFAVEALEFLAFGIN